ncbi:MAG: class I SAM-dependent methyltransferase [Ignavibacteria bacterium]
MLSLIYYFSLEYDPIKNILGKFISRNTFFRRLFYKTLGLMFLREWYVKRKIRQIYITNPPEFILDAGSGFGQYSYFIAKLFPKANIRSVDVKEDQIEDCKYFFSRSGIKNCTFDVIDLTAIDESNKYNFILSVDVMEHIEDDTGVFKRFYNALKTDGMVLINTPSNIGGSDVHSDSEDSFIGEHVRSGYSKEEICSKLESAGFKIDSFEYTYGKWGSRYWRLALKYPMLILNKSKLLLILLPFYYLFTIWWAWLFMLLDINTKNKETGTGILVVAKKI